MLPLRQVEKAPSAVGLLVMSSGGYAFRDFARAGVPMAAVSLAALLLAMRLVYGL